MYQLLLAASLVGLSIASATTGANLFIRQDIGCDLLPCATSDCDLLPCGDPGWGVVSDCACCGGQVGCNIPLGHTCGTQNGEPVCIAGDSAASSAGAFSALPSASSSAAAFVPSSSSSSAPMSSSSSASVSGSNPGHAQPNTNGAAPTMLTSFPLVHFLSAATIALMSGYVVLV